MPIADQSQIYNSQVIKNYLAYLSKFYPEIDVKEVLELSEISRPMVEDQASWFTQSQVDRFHAVIVEKTKNPGIAREAGRHSMLSGAFGAARQYTIGLLGLSNLYLLIGKINSMVSRGAVLKAEKLGSNSVEIISTPVPGVNEKPYQCQNRIGMLESSALLFSEKLATVEHPICYHKGQDHCRYIITWESSPSLVLKKVGNLLGILGVLAAGVSFGAIGPVAGSMVLAAAAVAFPVVRSLSVWIENKELKNTIRNQGDAAHDLLTEMEIRQSNSLLVREIGQTLSRILDTQELLHTVVNTMVRRMGFDRGLIMLADKTETNLVYSAGYGYNGHQENELRRTKFRIDSADSKGPFALAFKRQEPYLVEDVVKLSRDLSPKSQELAKQHDLQSFICVPIVFEKKSLGILAVDNYRSKKKLTESDIHLLEGVAAQTGVGIINAVSFQRVQESEKRYRELVENVNSIIMRLDADGNISFFNEFAQGLFGYARGEIIGQNIRSTILAGSEETGYRFQHLLSRIDKAPDGKIVAQTEHVLKNGGRAWITWTCQLLSETTEASNEILCVGSDTTELKMSEKEKKDLERKLQRAQKMEALGTLAGGVAHDLNNILSGIVSYPELLLMELAEDSPLRKPIMTIQKSGERAAAIVQDLLTLARRGVEMAKVVNLNDVVDVYLKSPEYEKVRFNNPGVTVRTDLMPGLLNMFGSAIHLSKVLMNLVANAAEAMPDGGEVLIQTRNRYIDKAINGYDNVDEGDYVTLTISDTGVGIPTEDQDRIFEPFYSKKVMGVSGTGLGLAIVWGTVKDHNGYIDLMSREGKGTRFRLYFPVTRQLPDREQEQPPSLKDYMGKGESILVVDDMDGQREIASQMLKKLNYRVSAVPSGEAAVEFVRNHPVDLLVLDMIMPPGMDGLETYREILQIKPGTRAIIASGFSETDQVQQVQELGAGPYVKKPYTLLNLGMAIRAELTRTR